MTGFDAQINGFKASCLARGANASALNGPQGEKKGAMHLRNGFSYERFVARAKVEVIVYTA